MNLKHIVNVVIYDVYYMFFSFYIFCPDSTIDKVIISKVRGIEGKVAAMTYRASNELRTASLHVLRRQRSGRVYRVPFTKKYYTASKAVESPAVRMGIFRL